MKDTDIQPRTNGEDREFERRKDGLTANWPAEKGFNTEKHGEGTEYHREIRLMMFLIARLGIYINRKKSIVDLLIAR